LAVDLQTITKSIKERAKEIGFDLVAVSPVRQFPENQFYKEWLTKGFAGQMHYLDRNSEKRADIKNVLPGAKSVICCAVNYNTDFPYSVYCDDADRGWISRYAWADDYHDSTSKKLKSLNEFCNDLIPQTFNSKFYVDTGPVLEKVYSKYSGIGWIGKNTCLINQGAGSWLFLGEIITDIELEYDSPVPDRCGTCTRCIEACPTQAIVEPYVLDSRKCISYLTIELKGTIPAELREGVENNIYGCDICQDVCPWNGDADISNDINFFPRENLYNPKLSDLANIGIEEFRELFAGSPIKRTKRRGLLRNVMIAIGNSGSREFVDDIKIALRDEEPVIRAAAVWAYWKIAGDDAKKDLFLLLENETDSIVRDEILNILD
jgi:epoxyqueuosine reductase